MAFFSPSFSPIERITLATWARFALRRIIPLTHPPHPMQDSGASPTDIQLWYNASTSPFVNKENGGPFVSLRFSYDRNTINLPVTMSMMPPWNASTDKATIDDPHVGRRPRLFRPCLSTTRLHHLHHELWASTQEDTRRRRCEAVERDRRSGQRVPAAQHDPVRPRENC